MEEAEQNPYSKLYQPADDENLLYLEVETEGFMTMVDGLLVNIINDVPNTNSCPFCHLNQKDFNKKKNKKNNKKKSNVKVESTVKNDAYVEVGLSILHFGPNTMKGLLKLASQQDFKTHRCEGEFNKKLKETRMAQIKSDLNTKLGISIDFWFNITGLTHTHSITLKLVYKNIGN